MNDILKQLKQVERFIGNVKFAVIIISIYTVFLTIGTFQESYHGAEYANRLIYKSSWFIIIQFLMFLSIFVATLLRLPFRKKLAGFYTLHLGLLLIFIGSFVTFYAGIDGSLNLAPNSPSNKIIVNSDEIYVKNVTENKELIYPLPFTPSKINIDETYDRVTLNTYYPYADDEIIWQEHFDGESKQSSQYFLTNNRISQEITLSLHEKSDYEASMQLGPLNVHYFPKNLGKCFLSPNNYILWDLRTKTCYDDLNFTKKKIKDYEVISTNFSNQRVIFIPKVGPLPINLTENGDISFARNSTLRIFDKELFTSSPSLFTFGDHVSFYDSIKEKWELHKLEKSKSTKLPFMGFELSLLNNFRNKYPINIPKDVIPIEENGNKLTGKVRAISISLESPSGEKKNFWIRKNKPEKILWQGIEYQVHLRDKAITMPFEITLERFKMDTDPGTNNPASYESFVNLFENGVSNKHHVFMNNPLKHKGLTFYQASYYQETQGGPYGSILSVNFDPGRWLKYLGSLLLVLGSLWHFVLRKKLISLKVIS